MNANHADLCRSAEWAEYLQQEILTPLLAGVDLGTDMVEFGPGPGAATAWLAPRVTRLTVVELDAEAADALRTTYEGTNVTVLRGDCTATGLPAESFDAVGSFTMLHHLPLPALQVAALAEAWRLLRPGGILVGSDSIASDGLHSFHEADTYNPVDPARMLVWLQTAGFHPVSLTVSDRLSFAATKPFPEPTPEA